MNGFLHDTDLAMLMCYDASKCRSQLLLPFSPEHYMVILLKFTSIIHHFYNISLEPISGYGTLLSEKSWHPWLMINEDRPEANHFHNSSSIAAVKILQQKHTNDPSEMLL